MKKLTITVQIESTEDVSMETFQDNVRRFLDNLYTHRLMLAHKLHINMKKEGAK